MRISDWSSDVCSSDLSCGLAWDMSDEPETCPRCEAPLHRRKPETLTRTWAYMLAELVFNIPANLMQVMNTQMLGEGSESTIISGVMEYWQGGAWDIDLIIFCARHEIGRA